MDSFSPDLTTMDIAKQNCVHEHGRCQLKNNKYNIKVKKIYE